MKISAGLFHHMVLQRSRGNVSAAVFSGTCNDGGSIFVRVKHQGKTLKGFARVKVGAAGNKRFSGLLKGLPAGGPYEIELSIAAKPGNVRESITIRDVLVGDVWLLGGQSNMQGIGLLKDAAKAEPGVRAFYMTDRWDVARDPIHTLYCAIDPVHGGIPHAPRPKGLKTGVGPGVAFGKEMRRLSGVPQGLIVCGHGGTSMSQWDPRLKKLGGGSLYGAMIRRLKKNGGKVAGLVWYQGCSAANEAAAALYTRRMQQLVRATRRDCGNSRLPVAMVQIARVIGWAPGSAVAWNSIQDQQRRLQYSIASLAVVPAIDLELDDSIHVSGKGQDRLGRRLARAMEVLRRGRKAGRPPIMLSRVAVGRNVVHGLGELTVEFDHVEGGLQSQDRPCGFELSGGGDFFKTEVKGNKVILHSNLSELELQGKRLHYGKGTNPYCNITDAAERSLPVFGPIPLGRATATTPFARKWRVSSILPLTCEIGKLKRPKSLTTLKLKARMFAGDMADMHSEIVASEVINGLLYLVCDFKCSEAMRLTAHLGYDGPVKVWLDGKRKFVDPNGASPALSSDGAIRFKAAKGKHEILFALDTNSKAAWGVLVRLQRLDVPARLLKIEPQAYQMPQWL